MAIFSYDIALIEDLSARKSGPGFLIHDSAIFADVDERQTAKALEIAAASAENFGYQHVVTMNSDNIPTNDFEDASIFEKAVVLRLSDIDDAGGILGQRI